MRLFSALLSRKSDLQGVAMLFKHIYFYRRTFGRATPRALPFLHSIISGNNIRPVRAPVESEAPISGTNFEPWSLNPKP